MGPFLPEFEGELTIDRVPDDWIDRIERRVVAGLLSPGRRDRADYHVVTKDRDAITFESRGFLTTYNIGLNQVTVRRSGSDRLAYHVAYRGWTRLAAAHGALLGLVLLVCFLVFPQMREDVTRRSLGPPLFWGMVAFWALLWPWILTAMHRSFAEGALQRILRETLASSPAS